MKLFKKLFGLILTVGIVGGIWGLWGSGEKNQEKIEVPREPEKTEERIKVAIMADIHSDWDNFKNALERTKKDIGKDEGFVIIAGDLTTLGLKNELIEAKKILDESGLKYFVIPGNHDIWWGRKFKRDVWKEVFGQSFLSFKTDGNKFILINNGDGIGGLEGMGVNGQKEWIEKETAECLKVYCLVFMHEPLNHPSSLHIMGEENPKVASEAAELIELFTKNNVKEAFAGHLHFSSSYELAGLKTTIVGALTSERNFQSPKFLEIDLKRDSLDKKETFLTD